ncbi:MAG TPA: ABC transporter ATP-binding protein [Acetobacteraceae bacterium]|jgi:branched-chain amino acid transport system ATP-binding protein|nr:ABC transporter ATP-binding protein [Acetobacteraceae bacterium]
MLRLEGVDAGYGRLDVLHGISLEVGEGAIVCLLGANGAGKTTTLNCICGVVPMRAGRIAFDGASLAGLTPDRVVSRGIVQVPEGRAVFRSMSVYENLQLGAWSRREHAAARRDLERALDYFPALRARFRQAAGTLSGGEQQMLMLARALLAAPKLLLLDEPSLGLAPIMIDVIFDVISRLRKDGLSVLLVEQNAERALAISDYGYVVENGEIAFFGNAATLVEDRRVREAYLGA